MLTDATRYPLTWPANWPRTPARDRAAATFRTGSSGYVQLGDRQVRQRTERRLSVPDAIRRLTQQLALLEAADELLSTNVRTRLDGLPRAGEAEPADPGVAVYFRLHGADRCLACDRWNRVADNIAALAAHVDAIRRIDRYGVGTLDQAFAGYVGLPARGQTWRTSLGFGPEAAPTRAAIEAAFRERARQVHPDVAGGNADAMASLVAARDEGLRTVEAGR